MEEEINELEKKKTQCKMKEKTKNELECILKTLFMHILLHIMDQ